MLPVMCIVQESQISGQIATALKSDINDFTLKAFGTWADIDWIEVPLGSGFTAAKPSTSLITSLYANRSMDHQERIALLYELSALCMLRTGLSENQVMTAIRDPQ
ncbi:MAG: hypothetical protein OIF58_13115 [Cohaesibacter sp.]|nr:hypothetical protein [Cohaesibacter sp.]